MVHAVDPTARRVVPDSFKNVVPSANVRMALLLGVHVLIHVLVHVRVHFRALNRISGIRRNDPRSGAPNLSAKNWLTNREGFRPPR
jgi:hypothetical protein